MLLIYDTINTFLKNLELYFMYLLYHIYVYSLNTYIQTYLCIYIGPVEYVFMKLVISKGKLL